MYTTGKSWGFLLAGLAVTACQNPSNKKEERPNIILIMADDITPEHFSCYGGKIPTPTIDSLAAQGAIFSNAYCTSAASTPSRFSILTGLYANRCTHPEFTDSLKPGEPYNLEWNVPLVNSNTTLHEVLNQAGYYTGFVGKFHLGDQNFDHPGTNGLPELAIDDNPEELQTDEKLKDFQRGLAFELKKLTGADYVASVLWKNFDEFKVKKLKFHNLEWITEGAVHFFDSVPEQKPFFLYLATTALHGPNHAKSLKVNPHYTPGGKLTDPYKYHPERHSIFDRVRATGRSANAANYGLIPFDVNDTLKFARELDRMDHYNTGAVYLDDQIKAIVNKLKQTGKDKNTLIIITADHGVEPGKSTCYEKGNKVPFIVIWPDKVKPGTRYNELVQFTDFMPTLSAVAGIAPDKQVKTDGVDFSPLLTGKGTYQRNSIYFEMGYTRAVSDGRYKYIATRYPSQVTKRITSGQQTFINHLNVLGQVHASVTLQFYPGYFDADQLYDLKTDPYEQHNLAYKPEYKAELEHMQTLLQSYLIQFNYPFDLSDTKLFSHPAYLKAVEETKNMGTRFIPWWPDAFVWPTMN